MMWGMDKKWKIYFISFFLSAVMGTAWFVICNPYLFYESKSIQNKIEGIYYDSKPHPYDWQMEMQENDGVYTQQGVAEVYGQAWEYETYQIEDNWYYYCVTYGEDLGFRRLS